MPLRWRDDALGALVIGEPTGARYTRDDLGLMEAIGEHAAGLRVTVQMSERRTLAREFEACRLARVTSLLGRLGEAPLGDPFGGRT